MCSEETPTPIDAPQEEPPVEDLTELLEAPPTVQGEVITSQLFYMQALGQIQATVETLQALPDTIKDLTTSMDRAGVGVTVDLAKLLLPLQQAISKLLNRPVAARSRRGARPGRDWRYLLAWKQDRQPVLNTNETPIRFRNCVKQLRGPSYASLLGDKLDQVCLIDTVTDTVVTEHLVLGKAPGGRTPKRK